MNTIIYGVAGTIALIAFAFIFTHFEGLAIKRRIARLSLPEKKNTNKSVLPKQKISSTLPG